MEKNQTVTIENNNTVLGLLSEAEDESFIDFKPKESPFIDIKKQKGVTL
jgi:hypothetical protein